MKTIQIEILEDKVFISCQQDEKKKSQKSKEEEGLAQLASVKIKTVSAPNSTILSAPLLQHAGQQSRLIGNTLTTSGVQYLAKILAQHYHRMGYPLCSVTGATLSLEGECKVETEEPRLSREPVNIAFAKEMVLDEEGNSLSFRQYKEKLDSSKVKKNVKREDLNTTFIQTTGKTRNTVVANAIGLRQGEVFQWDPNKWKNVANSGIWDKVLNVEPVRLQDGTVQLRVICQESHRRRVEYGVTKSLYTGEQTNANSHKYIHKDAHEHDFHYFHYLFCFISHNYMCMYNTQEHGKEKWILKIEIFLAEEKSYPWK